MKKPNLIYGVGDESLRREIKKLVVARNANPNCKMKTIVTEGEMLHRQRLGLSCRGYMTINELLARNP